MQIKNNLLREQLLPDIIINNAAGNFLCPFENLTPNGWERVSENSLATKMENPQDAFEFSEAGF